MASPELLPMVLPGPEEPALLASRSVPAKTVMELEAGASNLTVLKVSTKPAGGVRSTLQSAGLGWRAPAASSLVATAATRLARDQRTGEPSGL